MIKIIAIMLGVYLSQKSFYYQGVYTGFVNGAQLGGIIYPDFGHYAISHAENPYSDLVDTHLYINWFLLFFIVGKLIRKESISQIISLPAILLAFLGFVQLYNLKNGYVVNEDKYFDIMRLTFQTDFIHIWLALALLIYQIITAFQNYFEWKRNKSKVE